MKFNISLTTLRIQGSQGTHWRTWSLHQMNLLPHMPGQVQKFRCPWIGRGAPKTIWQKNKSIRACSFQNQHACKFNKHCKGWMTCPPKTWTALKNLWISMVSGWPIMRPLCQDSPCSHDMAFSPAHNLSCHLYYIHTVAHSITFRHGWKQQTCPVSSIAFW